MAWALSSILRRISVLRYLNHEQQLEVFSIITRIQSSQSPRQYFSRLPPELRAMIFEACIKEHFASQKPPEHGPWHARTWPRRPELPSATSLSSTRSCIFPLSPLPF